MRYLLFFFVLLFSNLSFADSLPSCSTILFNGCTYNLYVPQNVQGCVNQGGKSIGGSTSCDEGYTYLSCGKDCTCPSGEKLNTVEINGIAHTSCIPDVPEEPPLDECEESEKVYDPVSGTLVCPGSGDGGGSSSQASSWCLVPGDHNGDCIPDEGGSSAAASTPTSTPASTPTSTPASTPNTSNPTASTPSTGGGGGGDDDGSGNSGGGSASAAASSSGSNNSWTPHSGYGNWIPVGANSTCPNKFQDQSGQWWCSGANSNQFGSAASQMALSGECDYTSKSYFTCITSGAGSNTSLPAGGSNSSWTPISGYGNWIPVEEDSPCPNKFKDAQGKWWCAGGASGAGSGGAGGSSGSAASGGASGSARSASGKCDNTSEDYLKCISGQLSSGGSASSASSANSSSGSSRSGAYSSLGEKGEFDEELHEKKLEDLTKELEDKIADIKEDVAAQVGGTISGSGGIQDFCKNIRGNEVCFGMKKFESHLEPISTAIFLVCCVLAFVIVLRN